MRSMVETITAKIDRRVPQRSNFNQLPIAIIKICKIRKEVQLTSFRANTLGNYSQLFIDLHADNNHGPYARGFPLLSPACKIPLRGDCQV